MEWKSLITPQRMGHATQLREHSRSQFQRDYDRIIFSAPFRRMQNKTQVFPLPGSVFVHNRLTHSIEVASLGRSIGNVVAARLALLFPHDAQLFDSIGDIVSAACLAHDMGNPPFGHSGEKAIQHYFSVGEGAKFAQQLSPEQLADVTNFDGNANTFRILTHSFAGRREGGFALTFPTIASVIKYPRASAGVKKFGFFQQDEQNFLTVMRGLNMQPAQGDFAFPRYPLVYLVEAADDICYQTMDVEDACRLGILSFEETRELFLNYFDPVEHAELLGTFNRVCQTVTDKHEQVAYMRTLVIGELIKHVTDIFCNNIQLILHGSFGHSLISHLQGRAAQAMNTMASTAVKRIYQHQTVAQVELSGFPIIGTLVHKFIEALMHQDLYYSSLVLPFIPQQFMVGPDASVYDKVMSAVDTVSGMTDLYALDIYKRFTGTDLHSL